MKYCLKPEAKKQLTLGLAIIGMLITLLIGALGFVWFLMWGILGYPPNNPTNFDYILVTVGYFVWAFLTFYTITAAFYWLKYNIVKCENT